MSAICSRCKKPFVAWQQPNKANPTATWRAEVCPDCAPHKLGKPEHTLDCTQYIRPSRLTARLHDGFRMLSGRA